MSELRSVAALDGHQKRKECRSVFRSGVLLQGLCKRLVLHSSLGRQLGNEGRQECEWVLRVAFVLREVKRHAADEPPLRISLAEVGLDPAFVLLDLGADERVELRPPGCKHIGGEVLTTVHGRRVEYLKRQVGSQMAVVWAGLNRLPHPPASGRAGSGKGGRSRAKAVRRRQVRLEIRRCEVQETAAVPPTKAECTRFPIAPSSACAFRVGDLADVEMALRR